MVTRGEIWWAEMSEPAGSGPGHRRPVLVVQDDAFNRSRINTVVAVALTSNLRLADAPGNVLLEAKQTGLSKASVANVSQLITLDESFLAERAGKLSPAAMNHVDDGLRLVLAL